MRAFWWRLKFHSVLLTGCNILMMCYPAWVDGGMLWFSGLGWLLFFITLPWVTEFQSIMMLTRRTVFFVLCLRFTGAVLVLSLLTLSWFLSTHISNSAS